MSYMHIDNLYRVQDILLFKECYALEKIHGTSANLTWRNRRLTFSSGGASATVFESIFDRQDLERKLTEKMGDEDVTIYGEAYGGKMQSMSGTYGKELRFVVFDVKIHDLWSSVPQAHDFATGLGLEFVHYVKIAATIEAVNVERDADSVQAVRNGVGPGKKREGIVLRPLIELRKNNDERLIAKHKGDDFRETKTVREIDPEKMKVLEEAGAVAEEWVTAMRLEHVLDKIPKPWDIKQTPQVIVAVIEDVVREGSGEFVDSPEVRKAIGKKAAEKFKQFFKNRLV